MGIKGLLKLLDDIQVESHVSDFQGQVCGVDGYVWLHKAVYPYATELVLSENDECKAAIAEEKVAAQVMKYVDSVVNCGVMLYIVFDGRSTKAKKGEEDLRHDRRTKNRAKGRTFYREGAWDLAHKCFAGSVDVTPRMAARVSAQLKERSIPYVVAPYEADAQLSFLFRRGLINFCISEDSDLIAHGVETVLFKLDFRSLLGKSINLSRDAASVGGVLAPILADGMTHQKSRLRFLALCVLLGCDYGNTTIPKAGPKKVVDVLKRLSHTDEDFDDPEKIIRTARFLRLDTNPDFADAFHKALFCFRHHTIFDVTDQCLRPLTELSQGRPDWADDILGSLFDNDIARRIAVCEIDPITHEEFVLTPPSKPKNGAAPLGDKIDKTNQAAKPPSAPLQLRRFDDISGKEIRAQSQYRTTRPSIPRNQRDVKRVVVLPSKTQPTLVGMFKKMDSSKVSSATSTSTSSSSVDKCSMPTVDSYPTTSASASTTTIPTPAFTTTRVPDLPPSPFTQLLQAAADAAAVSTPNAPRKNLISADFLRSLEYNPADQMPTTTADILASPPDDSTSATNALVSTRDECAESDLEASHPRAASKTPLVDVSQYVATPARSTTTMTTPSPSEPRNMTPPTISNVSCTRTRTPLLDMSKYTPPGARLNNTPPAARLLDTPEARFDTPPEVTLDTPPETKLDTPPKIKLDTPLGATLDTSVRSDDVPSNVSAVDRIAAFAFTGASATRSAAPLLRDVEELPAPPAKRIRVDDEHNDAPRSSVPFGATKVCLPRKTPRQLPSDRVAKVDPACVDKTVVMSRASSLERRPRTDDDDTEGSAHGVRAGANKLQSELRLSAVNRLDAFTFQG
eukprot:GEMP01006304.1.p1 GENE.GEMP01006304.1~~GEMP01006304.1.p1  ORF type:complete len:870 (+),score=201.53 GEMP01006304.1:57-2612(+)